MSRFCGEEEFILNLKGFELPVDSEPRALIFLNHGYGMECRVSLKVSWFLSQQSTKPILR
ncbi:hypothetical protein Hanom_Chr09g00775421 [Helianthus anomalus]